MTIKTCYFVPKQSIIDIKVGIEYMAEEGPTCAQFISDKFGVTLNQAGNYLRDLVKDGTLEKVKGKVRFGNGLHQMYQISTEEKPTQRTMEMVVIKRDPLVAALFGPA